ncbi:MAG TPA: hypothetical protein VMB71_15510 [Acetobacteraceae bacterium]|nr:hypothetical protein [Acetobacteraceae bacterium]
MSGVVSEAPKPLAKLRALPLAEVLGRATLPAAAVALVKGCADVPAAIETLRSAEMLVEATRLAAFALPRREAVWWACMCARAVPNGDASEDDMKALAAAEEWVRKQTDEVRRTAFAHAQTAGFATPEAWAGVAAFWSGDSLSPLGQPAVPPGAALAGTATAGAVALASVRSKPERRLGRLARFLDSAADIANGGGGRLEPET